MPPRDAREEGEVEDTIAHPPPERPRPWWQTYGIDSPVGLLVAGALGLVVLLGVAVVLIPADGKYEPRTRCANHLRQLGGLFTSEWLEHGIPSSGGAQMLIGYCRQGLVPAGREDVLVCPDDPDANTPTAAAVAAIGDATGPRARAALAGLCSYAVRDFARYPVADDGTDPETGDVAWIACDRQGRDGRTPHHDDGLNVLFADGAVQFKDRAFLGIAEGEPIVVGPDSPHPELRKLVFFAEPPRDPPAESPGR